MHMFGNRDGGNQATQLARGPHKHAAGPIVTETRLFGMTKWEGQSPPVVSLRANTWIRISDKT